MAAGTRENVKRADMEADMNSTNDMSADMDDAETGSNGECRMYMNAQDREYLIELHSQYKHIVDCRRNDVASIRKRRLTWEQLTREFNEACKSKRSAKQLKKTWDNIKCRAKKDRIREQRLRAETTESPSSESTGHIEGQIVPNHQYEETLLEVSPDGVSLLDGTVYSVRLDDMDGTSKGNRQKLRTPIIQKRVVTTDSQEVQLKLRLMQRQLECLDEEECRKKELHDANMRLLRAQADYWESVKGVPPAH